MRDAGAASPHDAGPARDRPHATSRATARWGEHLETVVLPWWERAVRAGGGVFTCYDNRGIRVSDELYTWSQGRWAWLCAELADEADAGRLRLDAAIWRSRAVSTAQLLVDHALLGDGRCAFRLDAAGAPLPSGAHGELSTSVFADLFAALGIAGALRVMPHDDSRSASWWEHAITLLCVADRSVDDGTAVSEPYPVPAGFRDLAGPMNLLHTASELLRVRDDERARRVRDRAWHTLVGRDGFLLEREWREFRPVAGGDTATLLSSHRTPGHLLELLWMLVHAHDEAEARGDRSLPISDHRAAALAEHAVAMGTDPVHGGMFRYVDAAGGPPHGALLDPGHAARYEQLVLDTWDAKLWWVHVEALYATRLVGLRSASSTLLAHHAALARYTMSTFPAPGGEEWIQIRRRDGAPRDDVVALPVKDPFHIARSLLFLHRLEPGDGRHHEGNR